MDQTGRHSGRALNGIRQSPRFPWSRRARHRLLRVSTGLSLLPGAVLVAGCVSNVPTAIRVRPQPDITPAEVRHAPRRYIGEQVRWGGTILTLENHERVTRIEILARPLVGAGEPSAQAEGEGRFIAEVGGFLDPADYARGRLITVAGSIVSVQTQDVGDYPYRYPVVAAVSHWLWPRPSPPAVGWPYRYPWYGGGYGGVEAWYGPGFGSWYGAGLGPWYGPW